MKAACRHWESEEVLRNRVLREACPRGRIVREVLVLGRNAGSMSSRYFQVATVLGRLTNRLLDIWTKALVTWLEEARPLLTSGCQRMAGNEWLA